MALPALRVPVFISLTYDDLRQHRRLVMEALSKRGVIVHGMELFGARPGNPKAECLREVRNCRVYIGIIAMRYGSVDAETGKSMTQLEYEEAIRSGLPALIYLIDEKKHKIFPMYVDKYEDAEKLENFKLTLRKNHSFCYFSNPKNLCTQICRDLPNILSDIRSKAVIPGEITADPGDLIQRITDRIRKILGYPD